MINSTPLPSAVLAPQTDGPVAPSSPLPVTKVLIHKAAVHWFFPSVDTEMVNRLGFAETCC